MKRKFFLLFISCLIIGFSISLQRDRKLMAEQAQNVKPILLYDSIKEIQNIDPSILMDEEVQIKESLSKPDIRVEKIKSEKRQATITNSNIITAESYLVGNLQTGEVYISSKSNAVFPIASLSKLFTALIDIHILDQENKIVIDKSMLDTYGDAGHLVENEKFLPKELLYPLLLESSNDAAEAIAKSYGYKNFIDAMNLFTKKMGMYSTSFKDASGLSSQNISNANDLFILGRYLYANEKELLEITRQKSFDLASSTDHGFHHFVSINPFTYYAPFIGGKTGRTDEAKESMVTLVNLKINFQNYPIAIIVLRSQFGEREVDTEKILDLFSKKVGN
jgi:D-alanyl-D-alanine carboxypeptidase